MFLVYQKECLVHIQWITIHFTIHLKYGCTDSESIYIDFMLINSKFLIMPLLNQLEFDESLHVQSKLASCSTLFSATFTNCTGNGWNDVCVCGMCQYRHIDRAHIQSEDRYTCDSIYIFMNEVHPLPCPWNIIISSVLHANDNNWRQYEYYYYCLPLPSNRAYWIYILLKLNLLQTTRWMYLILPFCSGSSAIRGDNCDTVTQWHVHNVCIL